MSSISIGISQSLLASCNVNNVKPIFVKRKRRCVHTTPSVSLLIQQKTKSNLPLSTFLLVLLKLTVGRIEVKPAAAHQLLGNWENRWQQQGERGSQCQVLTAQDLGPRC